MFSACGYFPLWIRIKNHFTWFTENKKAILQTLKRLFQVPEIVSCDPDYETGIFMGVSFGRTDLLVYVLVPLCTRRHVRTSLGRNDVCLALEQLSISGVYFGRKSGKNGYGDDLSITSFSSVNESMPGDFVEQAEDGQSLRSFKEPTEAKKHAHYNDTDKLQNQQFLYNPELYAAQSENGKRQVSVMDFSVEDNNYNNDKGWQSQSLIQTSSIGMAEAEVGEGSSSTKQNLIPLERSTSKPDGKKLYTSTATFQVNMGNKSANSKEQPVRFVNDEIYKPVGMTSLNMSQPGFDTKERSAKGSHSPSRQAENGYSSWYEDTAAEDYYKTMIPEPEPGNTQQLYLQEDFYQHRMALEEETATPRHDSARNMYGGVCTPLYTPPLSFRDPTQTGCKLVMVKTGLVDTPKQQPFIVSTDYHSVAQHGWESPSMESNKLRQSPKTLAMPSDSFESKSVDYRFDEYSQHNPDRPDRSLNGYQQQHSTFTKSESEILSDYADSVFTDHDDTGRRFAEVPPPYRAPPDYKKTGRRSEGKFSDDSVSTGDFNRSSFCFLLTLIYFHCTTEGKTLETGFDNFRGCDYM